MIADLQNMPSGVHETIWQLFRNGPTWDCFRSELKGEKDD
jgi:hypothetical protein